MDYVRAVGGAFSYARHSKAVLAYLAFLGGAGALGLLVASVLFSRFGLKAAVSAFLHNPASLSVAFIGLFGALAIFLLGVWAINGTVIRNSTVDEGFGESWAYFSNRFAAFIGLMLLSAGAQLIVRLFFQGLGNAMPFASFAFFAWGMLFSLVIGFYLVFAEYAVVLEGRGPADSMHDSVKLVSQNTVEVLVASIVAFGIEMAIVMGAVLGIGLLALPALGGGASAFSGPLGIVVLGIAGIGLAIGLAFAQVVKLHFMGRVFLNLKDNPAKPAETPVTSVVASGRSAPVKALAKKKTEGKTNRKSDSKPVGRKRA